RDLHSQLRRQRQMCIRDSYNYERLEATGLVHSLSPIIKKLYADDPQEYQNALKRHMSFFNTCLLYTS
ncbi:PTS system mannose/fructose/sorbose family transporter subunit IID, partial [Enterococcus sp. S181_ASV_20]|nr:PTS system mannose/fructose/sorbose family transporter subunit IID [Enterococcus sp. S181_ASV_20]